MNHARPVTFDPAKTREAFIAAGEHLVDITAAVPATRLDEPALGTWTMRDLIGHASRALATVTAYLGSGVGLMIDTYHPFDYASVFRSGYADSAAIDERARQSGRDLGAEVVGGVRGLLDEATTALGRHADDAPVKTPVGVMRLTDYLPSRIFELVVHSEDIKTAASLDMDPPDSAMTVALLLTAGWAAESPLARRVLLGLTGRGGLPSDFTIL